MSDLNAKIIPLHSEVEGRVPTPGQVDVGEIALSLADKKIYSKNTAGEIVVLGDAGGLPGGGFKPNEEVPPNPLIRYIWRGFTSNDPPAGEVDVLAGGWDLTFSITDADGEDRTTDWTEFPPQGPFRFLDAQGTELWNGAILNVANITAARVTVDVAASPDVTFDTLTAGDEVFVDLYQTTLLPTDESAEIPLKDGDALRYDGKSWRPVSYRLEALDDVAGRSVLAAGTYWLLREDNDSSLTDGEATVNTTRVNLHPTDAKGVDRTQDFKDWRDDLLGITGGDGDQSNWSGTLTFIKNAIQYPVTVTILDDDMTSSGANQPAFQIQCDFFSLYPDLVGSGMLELKEFSEFLDLSGSSGLESLADGSVLQYDTASNIWVAQSLVFNLEDAANVALRVDAGSGTEVPKAIGDALLWDGSNWTPASPLSGSGINGLSDVNTVTTSPTNGQALIWDSANGYWKPGTVASDAADVALSDLTDTTLTTPEQNQFLKYVNGVWVNAALVYADVTDAPTVPQNIGDLGDVDLSLAPVTGQALVWDGSAWKPADQTGGGGGGDSVVGALTERADVSVTDTFASNQSKNLEFSGLGEAGKFVQVTVSFPAWVRFYATANDRDADALRAVDEDPIAGSGVLMELRTTTANEVVKITPGAVYYNNDLLPSQVLYARITNETGSTTSITTTVRSYTSTSTDAIDGGIFGSG